MTKANALEMRLPMYDVRFANNAQLSCGDEKAADGWEAA